MVAKTPRTVSAPKKFIIGTGLLAQMHDYVKDFGDNAFIISDEFFVERVQKESVEGLKKAGLKGTAEKFQRECTDSEIKRLGELAKKHGANVIVGIGGGKTLDTSKAVAHYYKLPLILYPTIASTDAPCIALAVIYTEKGEFDRYLFLPQNPDVVVADTGVIAGAPVRFFAAGIGDALSTYFEARACYRSDGVNLSCKRPSRTGLGLARMCYDLVCQNVELAMDAVRNKVPTRALEEMVEATIYLSGTGAETGGLAAAHAVHNGMTVIEELHHAQHGEKVVFGLMTQLVLENAPKEEIEEVLRVVRAAGLPMTLKELGVKEFVEADWRKVAEIACDKNDTMGNLPFRVTPDDVYHAMVAANALGERYRAAHPA